MARKKVVGAGSRGERRAVAGAGAGGGDRGTAARAPVARRPPPAPRASRIPVRLPPNLFTATVEPLAAANATAAARTERGPRSNDTSA